MNETRSGRLQVRLKPSDMRKLAQLGRALRRRPGAVARDIIEQYLDPNGNNPDPAGPLTANLVARDGPPEARRE